MKDQYAGDFGDYVKLALLRSLAPGRRLSVAWYRTPDDPSRRDGRHVEYLADSAAAEWRPLDPSLYTGLKSMVEEKRRSIIDLQLCLVRQGDSFFDASIESRSRRTVWFAQMARWASGSDLLFLDPDNGIASTGFSGSIASVTVEEIAYLRHAARTLIVYHHQTRAKGGHEQELVTIAARLVQPYEYRAVCALRAPGWSPRAFFIIAPDRETWDRAAAFAEAWHPHVSFHQLSDPPDHLGLTPGASAWHRVDALDERGLIDVAAEQICREAGDAPA